MSAISNLRLTLDGLKSADLALVYRWLSRLSIYLYGGPMTRSSSIADRVEALVRRMDGTPLCDECITDRLDLSSMAQASVATSTFSGVGGFERLRERCGLCGEQRHVIRYKS